MMVSFLLMNFACLDWIICIYIFWLPCLEEFFEEQTGRKCTGRMCAITRVLPLCCRSSLPTQLECNVLHCLKYRGMPPKKLTAKTTKSISLKGSIDCTVQSTEMTEEENQRQNYVKPGNLIDDPSKLESMTIKELRAVMKDAGLPVKGSKHDLLSTLRSYVNSKAPDKEEPSDTEVPEHKDKPRKRKAGVSSSDEPTSVSDTIERKERSRGKSQSSNSTRLSKTVKKEKSSVQSEVAGKKKSRSSEKTTLNIGISSEAVVSEPWTILMHKKPQPGWIPYNPIVLRPPPLVNDIKFVKLMSWNVNGLRALLKSNGFSLLHQKENFDLLCLQETKMQEKDIDAIKERLIDGYDNSYWTCSTTKLGYSGTAIISRIKPISVRYGLGIEHHDGEGRLITAEFENFYLLSAYVPNSGDGLRRLPYRISEWDPSLGNYMKDLEKSKPVVLTGDLNCAHEEMDIYDPAGNRRSAGFTNEERESFQKNFLVRGFVDTFRKQHPSVVGYTYYGYRHGGRKTNKGWRLDYFLVSESIANQVHDSYIVPEIGGSDHCPIGLILKI